MKKRRLACAIAFALLLCGSACAEDVQTRIEHFGSHDEHAAFFCSGRLVKLRVAPASEKMHGRMVMGDQFEILDIFGEWAYVEMTQVSPDNEDARRGMMGWIHADHIACECDMMEAAFEKALAELDAQP